MIRYKIRQKLFKYRLIKFRLDETEERDIILTYGDVYSIFFSLYTVPLIYCTVHFGYDFVFFIPRIQLLEKAKRKNDNNYKKDNTCWSSRKSHCIIDFKLILLRNF